MRFQFYRTGESVYFWRLLSRNHRIVAVAPAGFDDAREAEMAALVVRAEAAHAVIDLTSERGVAWRWLMRDRGGEVTALSANAYGRRIEAQAGAARFRRGATNAALDRRLLVFDHLDDSGLTDRGDNGRGERGRRGPRAESSGLRPVRLENLRVGPRYSR